ncbi:alpha/beta fold hydrolase [Streptomyces sp. HUAS MG91]|uniref:Alpha/beta fold hydrolase n=1 Tax=Streptomyces tabacisoli TaxID=3156398 RepID=A0AAU8IMV5_9ACTN
MTEFVLVPGLFTGPHVWRETAARLEAEGARAHPVDLPGKRAGDAAGGDLEADIARIVEIIDAIDAAGGGDAPEIVLVGHDYGVHPAVGAADRRPGRVARIVYVDTAPVSDGVPALATVPDQELRERLAAVGDTDGVLAPPARDAWPRWGSTAGVSEAALDRLTEHAAPQPLGTLLRPLRLSGAQLPPTTGVLCAKSGATLATVRMLLSFGDPMIKALARPEVTFFELPTGHWPMLSSPDRLAEVLLAAAAGGGESLADTADGSDAQDAATVGYFKPFLLDVTERPRERHGTVDLYVPEGAEETPRPAIVFVHGGPVPEGVEPTPRDWPTLVGYARCAADQGVVGVTLDHRLHAVTAYPTAAADVEAAVAAVRADPRVDADRIALWFFSGGGPLTAPWLSARPAWLRCLAANYPIMAPLPNWGVNDARFRPAEVVARGGTPPFVLVRVGREASAIAATVAEFLAAAEAGGAPVEVVDVPAAPHGFEGLDHSDDARDAVREAMRRVLGRLTARR